MKIGFIGLGHMGLQMAINLKKAGFEVSGYDKNPNALKAFAEVGGQVVESLETFALNQDVLITMLQTGEQVSEVWMGKQGLFSHLKPNTLCIDCSTIDVKTSRKIHEVAISYQGLALDAPVSGGVEGAKLATLTFMVGGDEKAFQKAKPFLNAMGKQIIHTGLAGSGQAAKICNNMILGVSMIAVSEAFLLAERLGLSKQKLFEVVTNSSGQCWVMNHYPPVADLLPHVPASKEYQPGFSSAMMLKDLKLSQESAECVGMKTPLAAQAKALYQEFNEKGLEQLDFSAIIKWL